MPHRVSRPLHYFVIIFHIVHDDPEKGAYVERLTKQIVTNPVEIKNMLEKGMKNR